MNRLYIAAFLAVLVMLGSVSYAAYEIREEMKSFVVVEPPFEGQAEPSLSQFGKVTLAIGETATFPGGLSVTPTKLIEDSRCPMNAKCIWAGTVKVEVRLASGMGPSTSTVELGSSVTTEAEVIKLLFVEPGERMAGEEVAPSSYRFTFSVEKRAASEAPVEGKCYVGGCSSQICSDKPDVVSTCEYIDAYACYQNARCERQATGQCGWTMTEELKMCLAAS